MNRDAFENFPINSFDHILGNNLPFFKIMFTQVRAVSAQYVMKCDDDTFVRLGAVLAEVRKIPNDKSLYVGNMNYYHKPLREGKWAVTYEVMKQFFFSFHLVTRYYLRIFRYMQQIMDVNVVFAIT